MEGLAYSLDIVLGHVGVLEKELWCESSPNMAELTGRGSCGRGVELRPRSSIS